MDRVARTEAITLLDSPISLAVQLEELDDVDELAVSQALNNIRDPCPFPYGEYVEFTGNPEAFTSWISPFLSDNNCTRPAIALSIPYLDHTRPQPTSHGTDDEADGEYPQPHQSYNDELGRFPEPRPYINYVLVQILYGLAFDYGYLDRNATGCIAYLQEGRDLYYKTNVALQKASHALQSVLVAAEMMENGEKSITDQMEEPDKVLEERAAEAQPRTEPGGHTSANAIVRSNFSLTSDNPTSAPEPTSISTIDTRAGTSLTFIYEDPALSSKYDALEDQLLTNQTFRTRNFYEMSYYQWKLEKLNKRRDRVAQSLSASKERFVKDELPLLVKIGNWYCRREEKKERLKAEKLDPAEGDVEMEKAKKDSEGLMNERIDGIEAWDRGDEILMDVETVAAEWDRYLDAFDGFREEIHDMSSDVSELGVEGVLWNA
ncbi:hypothetical protein MMC15_000879 [Xylographa vitiligo]|nr:hypothetical protein [Xylographa vitiligo]